mgnify:CR=1 FL=1
MFIYNAIQYSYKLQYNTLHTMSLHLIRVVKSGWAQPARRAVADDTAVGPAVRVAMRYWGTSIRDVVGLAVRVPRLRSLTIVDQVENRVEVAFFHRGQSSLEIPQLNRVSKFRNSVTQPTSARAQTVV